ncbi:MAG: DNA glycosylase, partial [Pseudonocardiaceae bacterium]
DATEPSRMVVGWVAEADACSVLTRQIMCTNSILIGIGNLYKTEMCFLLGVPPWVPVRHIDADAVVTLARRLLLANADHPEQSTTGELARGQQHWVYERGGRPCRRCGERVIRSVQGAGAYTRNTYYCPRCQPDPPRGAVRAE